MAEPSSDDDAVHNVVQPTRGRTRRWSRRWWLFRLGWMFGVLLLLELTVRIYVGSTHPEAGLYRHDPRTDWRTAPNLSKRIDIDQVPLHFTADTNSFGLRGTAETPKKRAGELRVLVLGDSFTWGIGVESTETFSEALAREFEALGAPVSVVNGGMPNYGTVQELAFYRAFADHFEADVVVLAYYLNDDDDNMHRFAVADGFLWQDPSLVFGHASYFFEFVRAAARKSGMLEVPAPRGGRERSLALINELRELCEADGRPLFVFEIPARETTKFLLPSESAMPPRPLELSAETLIEIRAAFEAETQTPYLAEHHLNVSGHALTARLLARELIARGAVPASDPSHRTSRRSR